MKPYGWILIILCTVNFVATFARQDSLISSEALSLEKNDPDHARKLTASEEIAVARKGQKGKGAYGGANVVHRRPGDKNAAAQLLYRPCVFILSAVVGFTLS